MEALLTSLITLLIVALVVMIVAWIVARLLDQLVPGAAPFSWIVYAIAGLIVLVYAVRLFAPMLRL